MSHVDDGTLHAYLDGELPPVEAERLAAHVAACERCRARVEEERALIERAAGILSRAVPAPPERPAPPLHTLRRSRSLWRIRTPLTWAATVVLALGLGWLMGGRMSYRAPTNAVDAYRLDSAVASTPTRSAPGAAASPPVSRAVPPSSVSSERRQAAGAGALTNRNAREEADEGRVVAKAAEQGAPVAAPAEARSVVGAIAVGLEAAGSRDRTTSWPVVEAQLARDLLGAPPVTIPGYPVRNLRRNPASPEIAVEQSLPDGVVILLYESRVEAADAISRRLRDDRAAAPAARLQQAPAMNERLARFPIRSGDAVVIATRGHRHDAVILECLAGSPAGYVWLLGSRRKKAVVTKALLVAGVPAAALERVRVPIGVAIGAVTPEEIAVSVVAELIAWRRGGTPQLT